MLVLFALLSLLVAPTTSQVASVIPVSKTNNAFSRGKLDSEITVDMFIDLGCSDCMNDWPMRECFVTSITRSCSYSS